VKRALLDRAVMMGVFKVLRAGGESSRALGVKGAVKSVKSPGKWEGEGSLGHSEG